MNKRTTKSQQTRKDCNKSFWTCSPTLSNLRSLMGKFLLKFTTLRLWPRAQSEKTLTLMMIASLLRTKPKSSKFRLNLSKNCYKSIVPKKRGPLSPRLRIRLWSQSLIRARESLRRIKRNYSKCLAASRAQSKWTPRALVLVSISVNRSSISSEETFL